MLDSGKMVGFVSIEDYEKARALCERKLGFAFVSQDQFALVMSVVGHKIRMTKIPNFTPPPGTVLGFGSGRHASDGGANPERYSFAEDRELGIWTAPERRPSGVAQRSGPQHR